MKKAQYAYFLIPYIVPYLVGKVQKEGLYHKIYKVPHIIQRSIIWGTFYALTC